MAKAKARARKQRTKEGDRSMLTCRLTPGEGSGRFMTAAPLAKGELLGATSGGGDLLSNSSGDGERSRMAGTSCMGPSMGAGWNIGISSSGENGGYHRGEAGGDEQGGEGDRERTERVNEPGLVGGVGDREERPRDRNA
jgi:hypothetical protein